MVSLVIRLQFEGWHRWKDAPEEYGYLSDVHRHMFNVTAWFTVPDMFEPHNHRHIEFIDKKREVLRWCEHTMRNASNDNDTIDWSCERWASEICNKFGSA